MSQEDLTKGLVIQRVFVVTELKRRHRQVTGHRTMNKLDRLPHSATTLQVCQAICPHEVCMKYAGTLRELRGNYSEGYVFVVAIARSWRLEIRARLPNEPDLPGAWRTGSLSAR